MKTKTIYTAIFFLSILVSAVSFAQDKTRDLPEEASSDWYKTAAENILQKEYGFSKTAEPNTYSSVNPKNQLGFLVSPGGFSVAGKNNHEQSAWIVEFMLRGTGRTGTCLQLPENFTINETKNNIIFNSPTLDVEYINNPNG